MSPEQSGQTDWERTFATTEVERQMVLASEQQRLLEQQQQRVFEQMQQQMQRQQERTLDRLQPPMQAWLEQQQRERLQDTYEQRERDRLQWEQREDAYEQQQWERMQQELERRRQPISNPFPPPPAVLLEGVPPTKDDPLGLALPASVSDPLQQSLDRLDENARRQRQGVRNDGESRQERARKGLGAALTEAVAAGYLTESRAITMIAVGCLNDRPMTTKGALEQVVAALAQAVQSNIFARASVNDFLARVGSGLPLGQGQTRPIRPTADEAATDGRLARSDDLIYEALTLRPCHRSEHAERHRAMVWVCDEQAAAAWGTMLGGLEIDASLLPRIAHLQDDGERAPCCRRDGNTGTWLRWGMLLAPPESPTPVETPA